MSNNSEKLVKTSNLIKGIWSNATVENVYLFMFTHSFTQNKLREKVCALLQIHPFGIISVFMII